MSGFFNEPAMTKQQRKHIAHGELTTLCAQFIAEAKFAEGLKEQDYIDALKENMSTKLGGTKREVILAAYDEALAKAKAKALAEATKPEATK